jgi:Protein of unknown function (DUF3352)
MTDQNPTQPIEVPAPPPEPSAPTPGRAPAGDSEPAQPAPPPSQDALPTRAAAPPAQPMAPSWGASGRPAEPSGSAWAPPPTERHGASGPLAGIDIPLAPIGSRPRRRNAVRWIVAVVIVALVVAGGLGATLLLTSSTSGTSTVLDYVPADTVTYAEARLDLPGSQRAEVAKTLSAFPGFADPSTLDAKLGELYDRIIKAATGDKLDYQTEIAPWFGGQIAVAQGPQSLGSPAGLDGSGSPAPAPTPTIDPTASLPPCAGGDAASSTPAPSGGMAAANLRYLLLADVTDSAKAEAWVGSVLTGVGATTSDRTCDGVVVHVVQAATTGVPEMGWAILGGRTLAIGDIVSIRLAIATKGAGGLSATSSFEAAVAALPGDHVGFMYEDVKAALSSRLGSITALDSQGTLTGLYSVLEGTVPAWTAADLKAADGNFVVDTVSPTTDIGPTTNRSSDLAAMAPSDTIALVDVHDLGKTLGAVKDKLAADPRLAPSVQQLDTALGLAGGFAGTIGWIGDAGFAVTDGGSGVSGGVIIRPDDADAAGRLFTQLRSLASLAGVGSGLSITDEQYKGATITTVDLSSLAPLLESQMGAGAGGMTIPSDLKLVYTATSKVVAVTLDPAFARAVIDASEGGDSLAKDGRFSSLVAKAGDKSTNLAWLDLAAIRGLAENELPADQKATYEADVKPYLLPIDALVSTSVVDNGLNRGTMVVSITH